VLHRLPLRLLVLGVAASLAVAAPASLAVAATASSVPAHRTGTPPGATDHAAAQRALDHAKTLFAPVGSSSAFARGTTGTAVTGRQGAGQVGGRESGRDATLVLTNLAHHMDDLTTAADRQTARALLARPTFGGTPAGGYEHSYRTAEAQPLCDVHVCVHYVTSTRDRVHATDADADGVPDYVESTLATLETVWGKEIDTLGYRAPKSDATLSDNGGDGRLDVYLQDLATTRSALYGYCAPDTDQVATPGYCVLENDYDESYFANHTPVENLEVTAAHEFFHAVQFAYNSYQDEWLMEGTAAWMEDEVFDSINDNRQYLAASPLSRSWHPLDHGDYSNPYFPPYGSWIFWRFLSESFGPGTADDPGIVKEVWERAPRVYSTTALRRTLVAHGSSFATVFARFGLWSRNPSRYFREGHAYHDATLSHSKYTLTRSRPSTGTTTHVNHMAQRYYRFVPGSSLSRTSRLRLSVNMADTSRGSLARVSVHWRSGALTVASIRLNPGGNGHRSVAFDPSSVSSVEVDMINDSTRFACNEGSDETCLGYPYDDGLTDTFRAAAFS
jgi:hypothetical protein